MASETIYAKTQKGFEEMTRRTYRLPARMRTLLIMIDGKQSAGELFARSQHPEEAEHFLESLLHDGFVEPIGGLSGGTSKAVASAGGGAGTAGSPDVTMAAAKRYITQAMLDALGTDADNFTIHIEAANDLVSLKAVALKYLDVIRSASDRRKAEAFRDGLVQLHLLEAAEGVAPGGTRASPAPVNLDAAKRVMVQTLLATLGPDADRFTMAAERAASAEELQALLVKYQEVVRSIAGRKKADEMVTSVSALLGR
jgi:hypothetical protein